ncbi:MAG: PLP-dependent aminotransferase family protein [Candidatus Gastranaerophilales bacterium]|nr:PLP-dependent aminotransferase family protein [Candidatus Gastranaerophilales bacterium]
METTFDFLSKQAKSTPPSLIRAILKAMQDDEIISFAGGMPNPISFPEKELTDSMQRVVKDYGSKVFQYSITAGLPQLREYIAERYNKKYNLDINAENIIITTGSQQAVDLIAKVTIDKGDEVLIEKPGYLGAIQAFSQYQPNFNPVTLENDGINTKELKRVLQKKKIKLGYIVPNFQNPTGVSYSAKKRKELFELVQEHNFLLIEDDPYGELRFEGEALPYAAGGKTTNSILLGSFSKTITPGFRLGYMITKNDKLRLAVNTAKEAADLHSNIFAQYVIWDYLINNDFDAHIQKIRNLYQEQCSAMINAIKEFFPNGIEHTTPQGGMFLWVTLPQGMSSMKLFEEAIKRKVAFVPGDPFYVNERNVNALRLNYTNASPETIKIGIERLGALLKEVC